MTVVLLIVLVMLIAIWMVWSTRPKENPYWREARPPLTGDLEPGGGLGPELPDPSCEDSTHE